MPRFEEWMWDPSGIAHIWRHHVEYRQVEEACAGSPFVLRARGGLYHVLGQTENGRYLYVLARSLGGGKARCVTAREMTSAERRRFERR